MNQAFVDVKNEYEIYLESLEFAPIRQAVFKRDGYKCVVCSSSDSLRAHHLTYLHVYHEDLRDLITLCDRCHAIYHNIDNRKKMLEQLLKGEYQEQRDQEIKEMHEKNEEERKQREEKRKAVFEEIKDIYGPQDYAKNGNLDMCSWPILNRVINEITQKHGMDYYPGNKTDIQKWFFYRRMELFERCLERGFDIQTMNRKTKFPWSYLNSYYRLDIVKAKLKEEETIKQLDKDKED